MLSMHERLVERFENEMLCEQNEEYRKSCIALCRVDVVYWVNMFAWTFDPRLEGYECWQPFLLFEIQEDYLRFAYKQIKKGESFGVEKSRDMGATWLTLAILAHMWLFDYGFTANIGSMVEQKVYFAGDKDTLFWKLEFLVTNLPAWMKPAGFSSAKHLTYMKLINPSNNASITGAAPTANFGRSGRAKVMLFDEHQDWQEAKEAWDSASQTTPCRISVGTPKGMNFYGKLMNPAKGDPFLPKFVLDWHDDPRKNKWYALDRVPNTEDYDLDTGALKAEFLNRCRILARGAGYARDTPRGTKFIYFPWYVYQDKKVFLGDTTKRAQELDRDYHRSVRGRVYPQFDNARRGRYFYNPDLPTFTGMDVGADMTSIGWYQVDLRARKIIMIDYIESKDKMMSWFVPFWTGMVPTGETLDEYTEEEKQTIRYHQGWRVDANFGDPSGNATGQVVDLSPYDDLESWGIEVQCNNLARGFGTRINSARRLLVMMYVDEVRCHAFIAHMEGYRWPDRGENHNTTSTTTAPVHDKHSHGATSYEYFAVNILDFFDELRDKANAVQTGQDNVLRNHRDYDPEDTKQHDRGVTGYGC